jgi:MSHA pilin protein MshC
MDRNRGFTLTELVLVLVIVAILSVFVVTRLTGTFAGTRAYYDGVTAVVQYGRKAAIAQRRPVFVEVDGAARRVRLCYAAASCAGADAVPGPPSPTATGSGLDVTFTQLPFSVTAASGVSVSAAPISTFQFDALGRVLTSAGADPGGNLTLTVSGEGTHTLTVERDTGYVHP